MSRFGTQDRFVLYLFVSLNVLRLLCGNFSVQNLFKEICFVLILFLLESHWYYLVFEHYALLTSTKKYKEFSELIQMEYRAEKYLNSIPADVLTSRAQAYNVGKLNQLKDQIPKGKELYANARGLLGAWKNQKNSIGRVLQGGEVHTYKHVPIGNLVAGEPVELAVPIVDPSKLPVEHEESDYTLVKGSSKDEAQSIHVGAVEVILDCFTSPDCNIYGGAMFVDTFHEDPKNAIRALFVTQLCGGTPPRCLFFPDTQVQLKRGINERFKLILATGNSDFKKGASIASLKVNVASCGVSLSQRYKPTPFLETYARRERANVIEYVGRYAAVIHRNNPFDPKQLREKGLSFRYGGKEVLTEKQPLQFVWEKGKEQSVTIGVQKQESKMSAIDVQEIEHSEVKEAMCSSEEEKFEEFCMPAGRKHLVLPNGNIEVSPQMDVATFTNLLDDTGSLRSQSLLNSRIAAGRFALPAKATKGTVVFDNSVEQLIATTLRGAPNFRHTYRQASKLRVILTVNTPLTTGIGLMIGYNSSYADKHTLTEYTMASEESAIWNPACQGVFQFSFSPNPCGPYWSYDFLRYTRARLSLLVVSGWSATPSADCAISWQMHVDEELMENSIFYPLNPPNDFNIKRWMGTLIFQQGSQEQVKKMPLTIGAPVGDDTAAVMTLPNTLAAMWNYNIGTFNFEFSKLSSPFIKGTLLAFIAMERDTNYSLEELQNFPNQIIQFDDKIGRAYVSFNSEHFAQAWSTQVSTDVKAEDRGCPYLYVVSKDCITSTISGDMVVGVKLLSVSEYTTHGYNPGIIVAEKVVNSTVSNAAETSLQVTKIGKRVSPQYFYIGENNWSELCTIDPPVVDESKQSFAQYSLDLLTAQLKTANDIGVWTTEIVPSPAVYMLRSSAWKRGTLHFKLKICGKPTIKRADWACVTRVDVRRAPGPEYLNTVTVFAAQPHADEIDFKIDVSGPNNGFESWNTHFGNQLSWLANVTIGKVNQTALHVWYIRPDENFCCAGNRIMASLAQA